MLAVGLSERSRLIVARGARAVELELLDLIAQLAPRSPHELASPVRVVVPSASLRSHVQSRFVASGRAVAGVVVQTLQQISLDVLERTSESRAPGAAAYEILVRRAAAGNRQLAAALAGFDDPFGIVEAAVSDFLDAGFEAAHAEPLLDKVEELGSRVAPHRRERVGAVVRVAATLSDRCEELGVRRPEQAPQRAAELLREHGADLLAARGVVIHGFADVTGVAADLLRALLAVYGGVVLLDRPPDPAATRREDAGVAFLDRLEVTLGGLARTEPEADPPAAALTGFAAPTLEAEMRQVAHRVRGLLDAGARPEGIGVVAREIGPVAAPARRQLDRLGIPFSGAGATVPGGRLWRSARLAAAALRSGPSMAAELWLEAGAGGGGAGEELAALRTLGVARLDEVAQLRVPAAGVPLPMPVADADGEPRRGRVVAARRMRALAARAAACVNALSSWPASGTARRHVERSTAALAAFGADPDDAVGAALLGCASALSAELPRELRVTREEWLEALCRRLEALGEEPLGGAGGGVQLLSVMEARGRTFDHLFVMCLGRGVFPRVIQEDALLPDEVRGHLAAEVLPELPVKVRGLDEERYLFAQLLSAAPEVTLSWHLSDQGAAVAPSPFVERLQREGRLIPEPVPAVLAAPPDGDRDALEPRPAIEHAILAAEHCRRDELVPVLAAAGQEGARRFELPAAAYDEWAGARVDVIEAIDPEGVRPGPGPWAGLVGGAARPGGRLPSITGIESVARCPLQSLLVRRLELAPMPDPRLGLPDPGGLMIGTLVHEVLQRIVDEATGRSGIGLDEATELAGVEVRWPPAERIEQLLGDAAEALARRHGIAALGMGLLLAAQARPYLDVASDAEWGAAGMLPEVIAAEVRGELAVAGLPEPVRWRADRLDRAGDRLALVDYKTGKPPSCAKGESTRRRHLLRSVALGNTLQGVAYALAAPEGRGEGRYLYLRPEIGTAPEQARHARVAADDAEMAAAFATAVAAVAEAWEAGAMFPRMEEPNGTAGRACAFCAVREACLVDDSAVRRRLVEWLAAAPGDAGPAGTAARRLWVLGSAGSDQEEPDDSDGGRP